MINVVITPPGSNEEFYAFQPLGMKVWRIENGRYDRIDQELRRGNRLDLPAPWKGPLAQINQEDGTYDDKLTASFLFITREGTCGAIQIQAPVSRKLARGVPAYSEGGLHYKLIYERDPRQQSAPDE